MSRICTAAFLIIVAAMALPSAVFNTRAAEEEPVRKTLFLPKSPVAAAYILARLSNKELIDAPRSEFVYVALLQRPGLERKHRIEALDGLAKIRNTSPLAELIRGIDELEKKGEVAAPVLGELAGLLLQNKPADLAARREDLEKLAGEAGTPLGRQAGLAALITADGSADKVWAQAESDPAKLTDLVLSIPLLRDAVVRGSLRGKVEPLLVKEDSAEVRRAAITAISSIPGREAETFATLASLLKAGTERGVTVASLQKLPRKSWPKEQAEPLVESLLAFLKEVPVGQRTEPDVVNAFQFATDLASLLPADKASAAGKALRAVGVSVVVIRTLHEQMLYDKTLVVVEAGKPVEIILINEDVMPHNLVIVVPGATEEVGKAAEKMAPEPDAQGRIHVPASPKVLHATKMIEAGQRTKLSFNAPEEPGDYQYVCTFPGHWMRMVGTLAVVKDVEAYLAARATAPQPTVTEWKVEDLAAELAKTGAVRNLAGGREHFQKLACVQCHKLGSEGYAYGPDLTDVFKRWKGDRAAVLLEILEPSKIIADRYKNHQFELKNGDELTAMIVREDAATVTLQTGPSDTLIQTIKKAEIAKREMQTSSLMPVGLLSLLSKEQILDLLAYIEAGGNVQPHTHNH